MIDYSYKALDFKYIQVNIKLLILVKINEESKRPKGILKIAEDFKLFKYKFIIKAA